MARARGRCTPSPRERAWQRLRRAVARAGEARLRSRPPAWQRHARQLSKRASPAPALRSRTALPCATLPALAARAAAVMSAAAARQLCCAPRPLLVRHTGASLRAPAHACRGRRVRAPLTLALRSGRAHASSLARRLRQRACPAALSRGALRTFASAAAGSDSPVFVTTPIYYVNDKPHIGCAPPVAGHITPQRLLSAACADPRCAAFRRAGTRTPAPSPTCTPARRGRPGGRCFS